MYRLYFINQSEQLRLRDIIFVTLGQWMDAWVLNKNCTIKVQSVSYKEIVGQSIPQFMAESSNTPIFFNDDNFEWERFIFNDIKHNCYDHPRYIKLLDSIKSDFLNTIFNQKNIYSKENYFISGSVDAYLSVLIGSNEVGFMEFIAPHAYFIPTLGKSINKKSQKLTGDKFSLISHLKIPVTLKMNFNNISFSELISIKRGSILKSSVNVENNFSLLVHNNELAHVSIGKRQNSRAYIVKGKKNG